MELIREKLKNRLDPVIHPTTSSSSTTKIMSTSLTKSLRINTKKNNSSATSETSTSSSASTSPLRPLSSSLPDDVTCSFLNPSYNFDTAGISFILNLLYILQTSLSLFEFV